MIGQLTFAFGVILNTYWIILFGCLIFGVGVGTISVAQKSYAVLWFEDKYLNTVFGVVSCFESAVETINFMALEPLYKYINQWYTGHNCLGVVMLISFTVCLMSFICAIVLGVLDKRIQRALHRKNKSNDEVAKLSDVTTFKSTFWMITIIGVACEMAFTPFIVLSQ